MLRGPGRGPDGGRRLGVRRELVAFVAVALIVLLAVAAATILITDRIARDSARREAEVTARRMAAILVAPLLENVLKGEPEDQRDLDQIMRIRMRDGTVTEALVWRADGKIVYATNHALEGETRSLTPELRAALGGRVTSDIDENSEVGDPVLGDEPQLEVYAPITIDGEQYAFEAYFSTSMIDEDAALLRARAVPLAVGALVVLQILQFPIAASMARRLSRQERERTELVRRHLHASDLERRGIAADLHDGPVQDLAGVSYGLSALKPNVPERQQASVDRMVSATRNAVASLRRLMVDIYPPDLSGPGLAGALEDLAGELRTQGMDAEVISEPVPELTSSSAAVLYRTAKEGLANVAKHAQAEKVWIRIEEAELDGLAAVRLCVEDDGVGLPEPDDDELGPPRETTTSNGHFGLRLVRDRVEEVGGTVSVGSRPGGGTLLEAVLPVAPDAGAR